MRIAERRAAVRFGVRVFARKKSYNLRVRDPIPRADLRDSAPRALVHLRISKDTTNCLARSTNEGGSKSVSNAARDGGCSRCYSNCDPIYDRKKRAVRKAPCRLDNDVAWGGPYGSRTRQRRCIVCLLSASPRTWCIVRWDRFALLLRRKITEFQFCYRVRLAPWTKDRRQTS